MKNSIQCIIGSVIIALFCVLLFNCNFNEHNKVIFNSNLNGSSISSEYSATPLNKWQISDNRIECLVSNNNSSLQLLKKELGAQRGTLEMSVRVGFFNQSLSFRNANWAGFRIGPKEKSSNYGNSRLVSSGINIGVCTNGSLFIGEPSPNYNNPAVIKDLSKGIDLKIIITPVEDHYSINFSIYDVSNDKILASISKKQIAKNQLAGDLVLVSSFESIDSEISNNTKSVWFDDWRIKGSKVKSL